MLPLSCADFQKQGDETVQFSLVHPAYRKGLKLVIMFPELAGYPYSHDVLCFSESEIGQDVEGVLGEVPRWVSRPPPDFTLTSR